MGHKRKHRKTSKPGSPNKENIAQNQTRNSPIVEVNFKDLSLTEVNSILRDYCEDRIERDVAMQKLGLKKSFFHKKVMEYHNNKSSIVKRESGDKLLNDRVIKLVHIEVLKRRGDVGNNPISSKFNEFKITAND